MKHLAITVIGLAVLISTASPASAWVSGYGARAGSFSGTATHTNAFGGSTTRTVSGSSTAYAGGYRGAGGYYGAAGGTAYHAAGWGYGGHYCVGGATYTTGTNWGDVAAGAAIGAAGVATGMAIAKSSQPKPQPVPVGTVVYALPGGCSSSNGVYKCDSGYYQPFYQGTTVVYQVVPKP